MQRSDTRVRAIDWLQQHATKDQTVLGLRQLAILPAEWKRLAAKATVISWFEAADLLERQRLDAEIGHLHAQPAVERDEQAIARWVAEDWP